MLLRNRDADDGHRIQQTAEQMYQRDLPAEQYQPHDVEDAGDHAAAARNVLDFLTERREQPGTATGLDGGHASATRPPALAKMQFFHVDLCGWRPMSVRLLDFFGGHARFQFRMRICPSIQVQPL